MKKDTVVVEIPKWLGCPHCFCVDAQVQIGEDRTQPFNAFSVNPYPLIYAAHKKCCNCGATKKLTDKNALV